MVKGLESKLDEKQLRCLASWQSSMPCLMAVFNILVRTGGVGSDVFTFVASEWTQANSMKLNQRRFRFNIRKRPQY